MRPCPGCDYRGGPNTAGAPPTTNCQHVPDRPRDLAGCSVLGRRRGPCADDDPVGPHAERGLRTRSRTDTSPLPSTFDGRALSDSTSGLAMRSSAASSMVTGRPPMDPEICELICRMAKENSRSGA